MAVVAHHPVVVQLEGVAGGLLVVDVYLSVGLHLELVALVGPDAALVDGQVLQCEVYALALLRNPDGSVVVACPVHVSVLRVHASAVAVGCCGVQCDALHQVGAQLQCGLHLLGEGHGLYDGAAGEANVVLLRSGGIAQVLASDALLLHEVVGEHCTLAEHHGVRILHQLGLLVGHAVQIDGPVLYLQRLSGQSHAALHVVLAAVGGSRLDVAKLVPVVLDGCLAAVVDVAEEFQALHGGHGVEQLLHVGGQGPPCLLVDVVAQLIAHLVVACLVGQLGADGVAGGIVEHHDVVQLHMSQSADAPVVPVRPFYV